jgi:hypothetical protein
MFVSIRRHQKWLWAVITTLTIISFVAFFSPKSQRGTQGKVFSRDSAVGTINGRTISQGEYLEAYREAQLRYYLSYGDWPRNDEISRQLGIMERETRNRLLLADKLREFNVEVTMKSVVQWIEDAFQDRELHTFRMEAYEQFVKVRLAEKGITASDFQRFVRHEVGIQHLIALVGLSGSLITPQEAEILYRRENEQVDTAGLFLMSSNYLAQVTIDPSALAAFYTNQQANYRIPERVQVAYVKFEATNFLAEADQKMALTTNLSQLIESTYLQRGTNTFLDTNNVPLTPDAAKEKIRSQVRTQFALVEARKKAIEFSNELMEMPVNTNNLAGLSAAKGLVVKTTEPFSQSEEPPGLTVPNTFAKAAFRLTPQEPFFEQPIVAEDGVYVIGLHKNVPAELPTLESIHARVEEDFRRNRVTELVQSAGTELYNLVTNNLAQGKPFHDPSVGTNATYLDLPPFSQQTSELPELPNRGDLSSLKNAAFALSPGKVSAFTPTREGGFIVQLQAKVPVSEAKVKAELPEFITRLRRSRQYEAFGEWFQKEMETARVSKDFPGEKRGAN